MFSMRSASLKQNILLRRPIVACATLFALCATIASAQAFDEAKYPDWKGQWRRFESGGVKYDASKPRLAQEAPLKPEYQAIFEANLKDQALGGQGIDPTYTCLSPGMPRIMNMYDPMEIVITPGTTHILTQHIHDGRRIYTDGRNWRTDLDPTFAGYSIGKWVDTDGDGRYDVLEVETRNLKGPRTYDGTGLPFHKDSATVIKERIYRDKSDPKILYDDITTIDNALTRPWTVTKKYRLVDNPQPVWIEAICAEGNNHVEIAGEGYMISADGLLMPTKKGQKMPDLRYFK